MEIVESKLDCKLIRPTIIEDERGWFKIPFNIVELKEMGIEFGQAYQLNHSKTLIKGVVRGLNYQERPYEQAKIIRCINGKLYSVSRKEGAIYFYPH